MSDCGATRRLMVACANSGDTRPGLSAQDVLFSFSFNLQLPPDLAGQARAKRLPEFIFHVLGNDDMAVPEAIQS